MASIWLKSAPPVSRCNGVRMWKWGAWLLAVGLRRAVAAPRRTGDGCWSGEVPKQRFDGDVALGDLAEVEFIGREVLPQ